MNKEVQTFIKLKVYEATHLVIWGDAVAVSNSDLLSHEIWWNNCLYTYLNFELSESRKIWGSCFGLVLI